MKGHCVRIDLNDGDREKKWRKADAAATRNATQTWPAPGQSGLGGGVTASNLSGKKKGNSKMSKKALKKAIRKFVKKNANNGGDITTAAMIEELRRIQARGRSSTALDPEVRTRNTHDAAKPVALEKELSSLLARKAVADSFEAAALATRAQQVSEELTLAKLRAFNSGLV